MRPELSRLVPLGRLPPEVVVEAGLEECVRLAARMGVLAVRSLRCRWALVRDGASVAADGVLEADVVQSCVVSLEPVAQRVAERFAVRFVPEGRAGGTAEGTAGEADDPDSPDEIPYSGVAIDLGEAAAEQLALALDPYPRDPLAALDGTAPDGEGPAPEGTLGAALRRG